MAELGDQQAYNTLIRQLQRKNRQGRAIASASVHHDGKTGRIHAALRYADGGSESLVFAPDVDAHAHQRRKPKMEA